MAPPAGFSPGMTFFFFLGKILKHAIVLQTPSLCPSPKKSPEHHHPQKKSKEKNACKPSLKLNNKKLNEKRLFKTCQSGIVEEKCNISEGMK